MKLARLGSREGDRLAHRRLGLRRSPLWRQRLVPLSTATHLAEVAVGRHSLLRGSLDLLDLPLEPLLPWLELREPQLELGLL